ncbi:MAG: exo-alpha-sialidase [Saprospiraceae bacterium]|nr:exo-alpha-sialidase [Saprospiraceae bacterium]
MKKNILIILFYILFLSIYAQSGGDLTGSLIFDLQQEHVHGPTIVQLPDGSFLAAWFQGSGERWADDVRIMGSRLSSQGREWSSPFLMADVPGFPDINPVLFLDQKDRLWLMWYPVIANQWDSSLPMYRISEDFLHSGPPIWYWQDILFVKPGDKTERGIQDNDRFVRNVHEQLNAYEQYLKEDLLAQIDGMEKAVYLSQWEIYKHKMDSLARGKDMVRKGVDYANAQQKDAQLGYPLTRRLGWQTKNKPVFVRDRLIVPLYSDGLDCTLFAITEDHGATWKYSNPVLGGAGIQATIAKINDQNLVAYLRDNGPQPKLMQRTQSFDGGLSWTIAKDNHLPNPGSGFDMTTLENGDWIIVFNDQQEGRQNLTVALSDDHGRSWIWKKHIENDTRDERGTFSHYPAVIEGADHHIHVVYSFHHRDRKDQKAKSIKYVRFPLSWIKSASE